MSTDLLTLIHYFGTKPVRFPAPKLNFSPLSATADGKPVKANIGITEADKQSRIDKYYWPYRKAFDKLLVQYPDVEFMLSMHSFTPLYEGQKRTLHIGVLHTEHGELATLVRIHCHI